MVLRGVNFEDLTGQAPFFRGYVRPGELSTGTPTGRVKCKIDGEWQDLPNLPGLTNDTLSNIEAFRIYMQVTEEYIPDDTAVDRFWEALREEFRDVDW